MRPVPPPDDIDFALLDRFLAGECSPAEAELVRQWLASHEAGAEYLDAVRDALPVAQTGAAVPDDPDALWARLARHTVDAERNADRLPPPLRLARSAPSGWRGIPRGPTMPWLRIAAAILLVAGAATAVVMIPRSRSPRSIADRDAGGREYVTARGERAELRLPDGTRVVLAPDSRLTLSRDYTIADRSVALTGHAYFDVKHDDHKPFQVRAGYAVAHDLGTRFDVRAYPGAAPVQVMVAEGKVRLAAARAPVGAGAVLGPGDVSRIDSAGTVTTARANPAEALAWTHGALVFDDVLLSDVVVELARWYDLDFRITDPLLRRKRLTLTLDAESESEALEAVAVLVGAHYQRQGRVVTLAP